MFSLPYKSQTGRNAIRCNGGNRPLFISTLFMLCFMLISPVTNVFGQMGQNPLSRLESQYPLDQIISLNGDWNITLPNGGTSTLYVPGFYVRDRLENSYNFPNQDGPFWKIFEGQDEITYHRQLDIPADWSDKQRILRIESANYMVRVYINDVYAGEHIGGYVPFEIDLTALLNAPSTGNDLRIEMVYDDWAVMDYLGHLAWPTGYYGAAFNLGLTGEVSLMARPVCQVLSQQIHTDVQARTLTIGAVLVNHASQARTVSMRSSIDETGQWLDQQQIELNANETRTVEIHASMNEAELWTPEHPTLYHVTTSLDAGGQVHAHRQRFGFQEFTIEGDHFLLNGVRTNLRGDNIVLESESPHFPDYWANREAWLAIVDSMKALNFNVIRFHQQPAPPWMLDICDEKGLMVIAESAIFDDFHPRSDKFANNAAQWLQDWVERDRNHPSIVIWSVCNEILAYSSGKFLPEQVSQWSDAILQVDPNRLQLFEGDGYAKGLSDIASWHYPWGYPNIWETGSLYNTLDKINQAMSFVMGTPLDQGKPISVGEFEWIKKGEIHSFHERRQAVKLRAFRILGIDDIRPYRLDWSWYPQPLNISPYDGHISDQADIEFLRRSMAPAAAFDRDYYSTHWDPPLTAADEGTVMQRNIIVLNDLPEGDRLRLLWRIWTGETMHEENSVDLIIPPGETRETEISFTVPYVPQDSEYQLELCTEKEGRIIFSEKSAFMAFNIGQAPPQSVSAISMAQNGDEFTLSWTPVTQNEEDQPTTIAYYRVTRATAPDFSAASIDKEVQVTSASYVDESSQILSQSRGAAFYRVRAVDTRGRHSSSSPTYGFANTPITVQSPEHFHHIPLLFEPERAAEQIVQMIPGATDIARWNETTQQFQHYDHATANFMIRAGTTFFIQAAQSVVWTQFGRLGPSSTSFHGTSPTSAHTLAIPLQQQASITAQLLMDQIEGCDAVVRWDEINQGFHQYIPQIPVTAFQMQAGEACFVHTPISGTWVPGMTKPLISQGPLTQRSIFHAVVGRIKHSTGSFPEAATFKAYIEGRDTDLLTESSPGCGYDADTGHWYVQCAHFASPWQAGERLIITINAGEALIAETAIVLNAAQAVNLANDMILTAPLRHVTLDTAPTGLLIQVDGTEHSTPYQTQWAQGSLHRIIVPRQIEASEGTRHRFSHWNVASGDTLDLTVAGQDTTLLASYITDYYLQIQSPYGQTSGSGWYTKGEQAAFSVSPVTIGNSQTRHAFAGWTGEGLHAYNGNAASAAILVSGPVNQTAQWHTEHYLSIALTPQEGGQVTPPPPGLWVTQGDAIELTAQAATAQEYVFVQWQGDRTSQNNPLTVQVDSALQIIAQFQNSDALPPVFQALFPRPGAAGVPVNAPVALALKDLKPGSGLNLQSLTLHLNEIPYITDGMAIAPYSVSWIDSLYALSIQGRLNAESGALVLFQLSATDLGTPPNRSDSIYAVQTGSAQLGELKQWMTDSEGGTYTLDEAHAVCQIPAGLLTAPSPLFAAKVQHAPALPENLQSIGHVSYLGPDGFQFTDSVTVKIPYNDQLLNQAQVDVASELSVYRFDTYTATWSLRTVDRLTSDFLYVQTSQLGLFALAGAATTHVADEMNSPRHWQLHPCYPNPFNGSTVITLHIPLAPKPASLTVYDCTGRKVRMLMHQQRVSPGSHSVYWDGRDEQGRAVSSGMYLIVLNAGRIMQTQKVLYLR